MLKLNRSIDRSQKFEWWFQLIGNKVCHRVIDTSHLRSFRRFIAVSIFRMVPSPAKREKSNLCLRRRDLIEATKTFRGYKSPRDDKIGVARRTERHAACRARTHARGILMVCLLFKKSHSTRGGTRLSFPCCAFRILEAQIGYSPYLYIEDSPRSLLPLWLAQKNPRLISYHFTNPIVISLST